MEITALVGNLGHGADRQPDLRGTSPNPGSSPSESETVLSERGIAEATLNEEKQFVAARNESGAAGISRKSGPMMFHLHGTFGDKDYQTFSGHVKDFLVTATLELFITKTGSIHRKFDDETALQLLDL